SAEDLAAPDVVVRAYGKDGNMLKESPIFYNAPAQLRVDLNLSERALTGPSEFMDIFQTILPFLGKLPLTDLTEDQKTQDITFLTNKTGLPQARVEAFAMSFRLEKKAEVAAAVFYGLIRQGAGSNALASSASLASLSFDAKVKLVFSALMSQNIDALMVAIQLAIDDNIIPYSLTPELETIKRALEAQQQAYRKENVSSSAPSNLTLKLNIAGLQGQQIAAFTSLFYSNAGTPQDFWKTLGANPDFQREKVSLLQSVFTLSRLTGEQMVLTDQLIKTEKIQSPDDL